jgi:formylglycine-generating enzyme required for sulfatase activity
MKIFRMNKIKKTIPTLLGSSFRQKNLQAACKVVVLFATFFVVGCGGMGTGELTGVEGRRPWFHPQPLGMVYVKSGTFHTGQRDQDVFNTFIAPNKQVSVDGFWMDETEITNNEYRQFVNFVIDSIARFMVDEDVLFNLDDDADTRFINYDEELDWEKYKDELEDMFYSPDERWRRKKAIDTRKLFYEYVWNDMKSAALSKENQIKYEQSDKKYKNFVHRSTWFKRERTLIYPDTLCWVRDFTYSYNEPMARHYYNHAKYDDYPVVGINWHMAKAFSAWRTERRKSYWERYRQELTEDFRLPTEYEWEYAATGGRNSNMYPWGGPYTRNSKGCMLANFKPLRGNYGADGGIKTVRADSYFPNDFGLYNMSGNVAEWTSSFYAEASAYHSHDLNPDIQVNVPEYNKSYKNKSKENEEVDYDGIALDANGNEYTMTRKRKVIRGGSWKDIAYFIQCGSRAYEYQDTAKSYVGFRNVQSYIGRSNKDRK